MRRRIRKVAEPIGPREHLQTRVGVSPGRGLRERSPSFAVHSHATPVAVAYLSPSGVPQTCCEPGTHPRRSRTRCSPPQPLVTCSKDLSTRAAEPLEI